MDEEEGEGEEEEEQEEKQEEKEGEGCTHALSLAGELTCRQPFPHSTRYRRLHRHSHQNEPGT